MVGRENFTFTPRRVEGNPEIWVEVFERGG